MKHRIQNFDELNTSPLRSDALAIAEAAYAAIDTETAIKAKLSVSGTSLKAGDRTYDLSKYKRIRVIGFGKASATAAGAVESLLHTWLTDGAVIDVRSGPSSIINMSQGAHPRPTQVNVVLTEHIVEMAKDSSQDDLVVIIVSGGGSSLLCYPAQECDQAARLYDDLLKTGATIEEMNTIRKHISNVKGGWLAKHLHPADVIGLIFCDIPGDHYEEVASGPTYLDRTTVADAQRVLDTYGLSGYTLNETPKDEVLFEHVYNVPILSNTIAVQAMEEAARNLGYAVVTIGTALYDPPRELVQCMHESASAKTAVLGAGESSLVVTKKGGTGGRCQYMALEALRILPENELLLPLASDGIDNSDAAGAFADAQVMQKARQLSLSIEERLADYDTYSFFKASGALLYTGQTGANVSDLFILLRS